MTPHETVTLAIIGGSGLYNLPDLQDARQLELDTPFGKPSAPVVIGTLGGRRVAFLARHGIGHHITPGEVNGRANIHALKQLGVERLVGINACGSLREDYVPGDIVLPDQLYDLTHQRARSFFGEGLVAHVGVADPFCSHLTSWTEASLRTTGATVHRGGTFIIIEGPRFSTRAESHTYRSWGMSIVGMTAIPEAFLAREAEMCYTSMAHITDFDVWHVSEAPVSADMVVQVLHKNTQVIQQALLHLAQSLPDERPCTCGSALANALITDPKVVPEATKKKLELLVGKYLHD